MATERISLAKLQELRARFHNDVVNSPEQFILRVTDVASAGSFTDFTGDSNRTSKDTGINCLFRDSFTPVERTQWGLDDSTTLVMYLSPRQVFDKFGTYDLDKFRTKVVRTSRRGLAEKVFAISDVLYKSPYYGTLFHIEVHCKTITTGG